jgi:two-component system CheB/CheR fusion protein
MADGAKPDVDPGLEDLLEFLRTERGFDFSGYKRASLGRRISKRMHTLGVDDFRAYQQRLEAEPNEFNELFNTILINVTAFQRDGDAWQFLSEHVIPKLLEGKAPDDPVRAWSAGCASGEEAYSLAVVLCDVMGEDAFRQRVKVYGTDADEDALAVARLARYPATAVHEAFNAEQVERYFESDGDGLVFRKDLRRAVIFGRHDLVQDPPISRVDLLVCRNTLMYFNNETQHHILANFHFALIDSGFLFLGKSESLAARGGLFLTVDQKRHVFTKARTEGAARQTAGQRPRVVPRVRPPDDVADLTFENAPVAQVVIDRAGILTLANRHARTLFGLGVNQIGRPFKDVELSYRPVELRSRIDEVFSERRTTTINDIQLTMPGGAVEFLDAHLVPLVSDSGTTAVALTFMEVGRYKVLREELERAQRELEAAYEELQSTNEELETTNEELQSTNEELETTNEEVQSTNEELETMNEELQSTNEELEATNNELRQRSVALDETNIYLEAILGSLGSGVIVLNRQLVVRLWNRVSEDLWGLRREEVEGEHFLNLDIGLPVDQLSQSVRSALGGQDGIVDVRISAVNRRGRAIDVDVRVAPLRADGQDPEGVIVLARRVGETT